VSKPNEVPFHGLFLPEDGLNADLEPEPILKIFVSRFESRGKVRVPQAFSPDELREPSDIFARFGGGSYELEARRHNGTIYAKRIVNFPGPSKDLVDPTAAETPAATLEPARPIPSGIDPMLAMMMQQQQDAAMRSQALILGLATAFAPVIAAMVSKGGEKAPGSSPAELITAIAAMATANKPPPPAPPTPLSEVLALQKAIDDNAARRVEGINDQARRNAPEESVGDTIKSIVEAAGPLLMALPTVAPALPKLGP